MFKNSRSSSLWIIDFWAHFHFKIRSTKQTDDAHDQLFELELKRSPLDQCKVRCYTTDWWYTILKTTTGTYVWICLSIANRNLKLQILICRPQNMSKDITQNDSRKKYESRNDLGILPSPWRSIEFPYRHQCHHQGSGTVESPGGSRNLHPKIN